MIFLISATGLSVMNTYIPGKHDGLHMFPQLVHQHQPFCDRCNLTTKKTTALNHSERVSY